MHKPIFGLDFGPIPIYLIMLCVAAIAGIITFKKTFKKDFFSNCVRKRINRSFFWGGIAGVLGANIINWIVFDNVMGLPLFQRLTQGGFSFYFGLLSFLGASTIFLRINKINLKFALNKIVSPILIVQSIARIGCSLSGCCWGKSIDILDASFSVPVREAEAIFALVLFLILQKRAFSKHLRIYLFSYSLFRFFTDFLRGDDRGSLFGITALSPTQFVSIFVILISGAMLFTRPFMKLLGQEKVLDDIKIKIKTFFAQIRSKLFPKKAPYEPVPFKYIEPAGKKHPLKAIIAVLLVIAIVFLSVAYINPFNSDWLDDISGSISSLFAPGSTENQIGETNGAELVHFVSKDQIKNETDALKLAESVDTWIDFELGRTKTKTLPNGNNAYVFTQEFKGKPIYGKTRVLVADKDGNPLYMAGDAASLSYTDESVKSFVSDTPTVKEAFGSDAKVTNKTDCWYDTGNGLVEAYHATVSNSDKTLETGVIVQKNNNKIICLSEREFAASSDSSAGNITTASDTMLKLLETNDEQKIEELSKFKVSGAAEAEKDLYTILKALCSAYMKLDITASQFSQIVDSASKISESIPSVNIGIYGEIISEETRTSLINSGESESSAKSLCDKLRSVLKKSGIKPSSDEAASEITATTYKSTFRYSIDFSNDTDVFRLTSLENSTTEITINTETPVSVEIYDDSGRAVVSMYVEDKETISLYPEDGSSFNMRIGDCSSADKPLSSSSVYKISLKAFESSVPKEIQATISRISDAYSYSLAPVFLSMCLEDGAPLPIEESIGASLAAPILDSCSSECAGMGDQIDTAKSMIAGVMIRNGESNPDLLTLKGTTMDLSYVYHVETENYIALKTKIVISIGGMDIYNGYSFMRLENYDYDLSEISPELQSTVDMIEMLFGETYFITDINHNYLYELFGDSPDSISATSDISSLYDLWYDSTETISVYPITVKNVDTEKALRSGHSLEKIEGFEQYTLRHNLGEIKKVRAAVQIQYNVLSGIATYGEPAKALFDLVTNPLGFVLDQYFEQQEEEAQQVWFIVKFAFDPVGTITDAITGELWSIFFAACGDVAQEIKLVLDEFDSRLVSYETRYAQLSAHITKRGLTIFVRPFNFYYCDVTHLSAPSYYVNVSG